MSDCLNEATIQFYAAAPVADLSRLSARERMESIRLITKAMFNEAAKRVENKEQPQHIPHPHDFPDECKALTNLSLSISHSPHFTRMIMNAADRTVMDMVEDADMMHALKNWGTRTEQRRKYTLRQVVRHFVSACRAATDIPYAVPLVDFSRTEPDGDRSVICGQYSHIDADTPADNGLIDLNTHRAAGFHKAYKACRTALHEAVHAIDDQTGEIGARNPRLTRDYDYDARLARMHKQHCVIIPHILDEPYRAQSHERLAYDADARFGQKLRAALA